MPQSIVGTAVSASFGVRTGIYLAPQRAGANFCGTIGTRVWGME
jgi:hypothetical protein